MKDERAPCGPFLAGRWTIKGGSHSPLCFLLADTFTNDLLDFRIHDLVVAGWLHSLRRWKYKQNAQSEDTEPMTNIERKTKSVWVFLCLDFFFGLFP